MKIKKFDTKSLNSLREFLNEDLKKISEKYGISMEVGKIGYTEFTASIKIEATISSSEGEKANIDDFIRNATLYGDLSKNQAKQALNFSFTEGRFIYTVAGYNPSKPKNAVKLKRNDGKRFSCSWSMLKSRMMLKGIK